MSGMHRPVCIPLGVHFPWSPGTVLAAAPCHSKHLARVTAANPVIITGAYRLTVTQQLQGSSLRAPSARGLPTVPGVPNPIMHSCQSVIPKSPSTRARATRKLFSGSVSVPRCIMSVTAAASGDTGMASDQTTGRALHDANLNKVPVGMKMGSDTYKYLLDHTREPQLLAELRAETAQNPRYFMQITPEQGVFMGILAKLAGAKKAIEVGVFTGYSAVSLAQALPDDGVLYALDINEETVAVARRYFERAGVAHKVRPMIAPAVESLQKILQDQGPDSIDFAFIDADKPSYKSYYELLIKLVRPGGLIAIDNVLWSGRVADPAHTDEDTVALRALNDQLLADQRIDFSIIPVGDGIALCRKR